MSRANNQIRVYQTESKHIADHSSRMSSVERDPASKVHFSPQIGPRTLTHNIHSPVNLFRRGGSVLGSQGGGTKGVNIYQGQVPDNYSAQGSVNSRNDRISYTSAKGEADEQSSVNRTFHRERSIDIRKDIKPINRPTVKQPYMIYQQNAMPSGSNLISQPRVNIAHQTGQSQGFYAQNSLKISQVQPNEQLMRSKSIEHSFAAQERRSENMGERNPRGHSVEGNQKGVVRHSSILQSPVIFSNPVDTFNFRREIFVEASRSASHLLSTLKGLNSVHMQKII